MSSDEQPLGLAALLDEEGEWQRLMARVHRSIERRELSGQAVEFSVEALGGVLFVAGIMALAQLAIDTEMIRIVTICALSGIALAFGLSLGLGSRDVTRSMIAGFYARKLLRPGDTVTVGEHTGTLVMITPTQTVIQVPAQPDLAVPNGVFLDSDRSVRFVLAERPDAG
ncbi:MAG TPA: mechanosensitive ion channel domain-containing protein [Vicinamibacterales bacterium]|nr:mechanosensitive ion channel domain-containing protein [Vicinamibacterales bacterium]